MAAVFIVASMSGSFCRCGGDVVSFRTIVLAPSCSASSFGAPYYISLTPILDSIILLVAGSLVLLSNDLPDSSTPGAAPHSALLRGSFLSTTYLLATLPREKTIGGNPDSASCRLPVSNSTSFTCRSSSLSPS